MRCAHLVLAGIVGTIFAGAPMSAALADGPAPAPPTATPSTQPADLASFADLIKKCTDYDRTSINWKWSTIYTADFRPGQPATWHPDESATDLGGNVNPSAVQTHLIQEQGHDELVISGQLCDLTFLDVGPKVRGEVAVDMVCKNIGPRLCDLSIILGSYHSGPGFQFGSFDNTKAVIFSGAGTNENANAADAQGINCTGSPQTFQANQWYHVRLEVKNGQVRGIVDGHEVGKVALNSKFPLGQANQPFLYTYNSQMVVRELHVEAWARDTKGVDPAAWSKVFGNDNPAAVQKQLDDLVRFLADRDPATRDKAEHILTDMGELAIPALQRAEASDVPELTVRAEAILQTLSASGKAPGGQ